MLLSTPFPGKVIVKLQESPSIRRTSGPTGLMETRKKLNKNDELLTTSHQQKKNEMMFQREELRSN